MEISLSVNHISTLVVLVTDLSKAFDTVDHVALLKRLEWHGIRVIASIKIYNVNVFLNEKKIVFNIYCFCFMNELVKK